MCFFFCNCYDIKLNLPERKKEKSQRHLCFPTCEGFAYQMRENKAKLIEETLKYLLYLYECMPFIPPPSTV